MATLKLTADLRTLKYLAHCCERSGLECHEEGEQGDEDSLYGEPSDWEEAPAPHAAPFSATPHLTVRGPAATVLAFAAVCRTAASGVACFDWEQRGKAPDGKRNKWYNPETKKWATQIRKPGTGRGKKGEGEGEQPAQPQGQPAEAPQQEGEHAPGEGKLTAEGLQAMTPEDLTEGKIQEIASAFAGRKGMTRDAIKALGDQLGVKITAKMTKSAGAEAILKHAATLAQGRRGEQGEGKLAPGEQRARDEEAEHYAGKKIENEEQFNERLAGKGAEKGDGPVEPEAGEASAGGAEPLGDDPVAGTVNVLKANERFAAGDMALASDLTAGVRPEDRPAFDRAILDMAREDKLSLARQDHPGIASDEERAALIRDPKDGTYYMGVSPRAGGGLGPGEGELAPEGKAGTEAAGAGEKPIMAELAPEEGGEGSGPYGEAMKAEGTPTHEQMQAARDHLHDLPREGLQRLAREESVPWKGKSAKALRQELEDRLDVRASEAEGAAQAGEEPITAELAPEGEAQGGGGEPLSRGGRGEGGAPKSPDEGFSAAARAAVALGVPGARSLGDTSRPLAERVEDLGNLDIAALDGVVDSPLAKQSGIHNNEFLRTLSQAMRQANDTGSGSERGRQSALRRSAEMFDRVKGQIQDTVIPGLRKLADAGVAQDKHGDPFDPGAFADFYEQHALPLIDSIKGEVAGGAAGGQTPGKGGRDEGEIDLSSLLGGEAPGEPAAPGKGKAEAPAAGKGGQGGSHAERARSLYDSSHETAMKASRELYGLKGPEKARALERFGEEMDTAAAEAERTASKMSREELYEALKDVPAVGARKGDSKKRLAQKYRGIVDEARDAVLSLEV